MFKEHRNTGRSFVLRLNKPDRHAAKRLHRNVERDAHALHGTAQDHAFAVKFDLARALVRRGIVGREADRQVEWVGPRAAARPGGAPAEFCLRPQNTLPAGLFFRPGVDRSMPRGSRNQLKIAGKQNRTGPRLPDMIDIRLRRMGNLSVTGRSWTNPPLADNTLETNMRREPAAPTSPSRRPCQPRTRALNRKS